MLHATQGGLLIVFGYLLPQGFLVPLRSLSGFALPALLGPL
jgi:hypothetical protein